MVRARVRVRVRVRVWVSACSNQSPSRAPRAATRGGCSAAALCSRALQPRSAAARAACVSTWLGEG